MVIIIQLGNEVNPYQILEGNNSNIPLSIQVFQLVIHLFVYFLVCLISIISMNKVEKNIFVLLSKVFLLLVFLFLDPFSFMYKCPVVSLSSLRADSTRPDPSGAASDEE